MKIAVFHVGFMYSGGGERTALYECIELKKRGYDVSCFAPTIREDVCYPELIKQVGPKGFLPKIPLRLPLRDFISLSASSILTPLLSRKFADFDVILCHGQPTVWIAYEISRVTKEKYFCYLHQPARFLYPRQVDTKDSWKTKSDFALLNDLTGLAKPLVKTFDYISVVSAESVFVNSRWIANQVTKIYGLSPIVCPPAVDIENFTPIPNKHDVTINGVKIKRPFILTTNRHYSQKGIEYAITIMARIPDTRLVITGEFTNYTSKLLELSKILHVEDRVVFTERIEERSLIELYQNASIHLYTSPCEDFGLSAIEAMACGTPVVVWDYAGTAETVVNGTGYRAKPYEVDDLAEKVMRLLEDSELNRKIGENGVRHVKENYSWEKHVDILEKEIVKRQ